jgi:hypothetical protein
MSVQHANRGIVKKDLQLYYNREFVKSFRGEATINTCNLNSRYNYVPANAAVTRDTVAPSPPPITGFEIAKLRSTDGLDTQTILYTASVDQVNGGTYTHSAYIYLESGTYVKVGQHWNPWDYGVPNYIPKNKWTRVSYTVTNTPNNYGDVACAYNTDGTIYVTATQYEKKSYSTPFVNGSRTANTIAGGGGLLDISGNNINADLGNVSFDSTGYIFTGASSNRIQFTTPTSFIYSAAGKTVLMWVNYGTSSYVGFCGLGNAATGQSFNLRSTAAATAQFLGFMGYAADYDPSAGPVINNNVWHLIGATFDAYGAGNLKLYVDGVNIATTTNTLNTAPEASNIGYIGRSSDGAAPGYFTGQAGQFMMYNRALSADEVLQIFNSQRKTYGV